MKSPPAAIPSENIELLIRTIRGQKVILDNDLARFRGPGQTAERTGQTQCRRFPADFMFQLTDAEHDALRSQIATLKPGRGQHRKYLPYAFTENGAIMAADRCRKGRPRVLVGPVRVDESLHSNLPESSLLLAHR